MPGLKITTAYVDYKRLNKHKERHFYGFGLLACPQTAENKQDKHMIFHKSEQKGNDPPGGGVTFGVWTARIPDGLVRLRSSSSCFNCARLSGNYLQPPAVGPTAFGRSAPERRRGNGLGATSGGGLNEGFGLPPFRDETAKGWATQLDGRR